MIWNVPDFIEGLSEKQPGAARQGKTLRNRNLCKVKKHTQTAASTSWQSAGTFQTKPNRGYRHKERVYGRAAGNQ
jgi:hypothetical protein